MLACGFHCVHFTLSNIEICRQVGPKIARHKEDNYDTLLNKKNDFAFLVEVWVVSLYQKNNNSAYLDCFVNTIMIYP